MKVSSLKILTLVNSQEKHENVYRVIAYCNHNVVHAKSFKDQGGFHVILVVIFGLQSHNCDPNKEGNQQVENSQLENIMDALCQREENVEQETGWQNDSDQNMKEPL